MSEQQLPAGVTPVGLPPGVTPVAEEPEDIGVAKFVDRVVRQIASGATLGFADEFAAFMDSRIGDLDFDKALSEERAKDAAFERDFPGTALGAKIAGGIASPVAKLGVPAAGTGAVRGAVQATGVGAGIGAVTAAGEAEGDLINRGKAAITGGITGAVAGGGTSLALSVAGAGVKRLSRFVTGKIGPESEAGRQILSALRDDKISAQEAIKRLREMGPESGLADIGEENVRGVARAAASTPGPARTVAKEFLKDRQLTQGERITQAAQRAFKDFRKFSATSDDLIEARAAAAAPKYAEAYQTQIPLTDDLLEILQTDAGKKAFKLAQRIASNEGRKLPEILQITEGGTARINVEAVPDMRAWDIIKRAFDTTLNRQRNPLTNKLDLSDPLTRSVNEVRGRLVATLDNLNPAYAEARGVFAGPAQALSAMGRGRTFLKGDADETLKALKEMSPADKDFFRLGVIQGIRDVVENTRDVTDVTGRLFGSQTMRDKIKAVFPKGKSFSEFKMFMQTETMLAETRKVVLGGSPTARIQAEQRRLGSITAGLDEAIGGNITGAVLRTALSAMRKEVTPEVSEQLGKLLFTQGRVNEANIRKIFRAEPLGGISEGILNTLRGRLVAGAAVGSTERTNDE